MSRLLLFLFGLILLGLLAYFCIRNHAPIIEQDLSTRASTALNNEELYWVQSSIEGRQIKLTGTAKTNTLRDQAGIIATGIWGIAGVENKIIVDRENIGLSKSAGDYYTQFTIINGNIELQGMVPNLKAHKMLIDLAAEHFGSNHVIDQLDIQSTAPRGWNQAAEAALFNARVLKNGSAILVNNKMHLKGTAATSNDRSQIQSAISNILPSDFEASFDIAVPKSSQAGLSRSTQQKLMQAEAYCQKGFDNLLSGQQIFFKLDSDIINTQSNLLLDKLIKVAKSCQNTRILISGHTDSLGSAAYNTQLSRRRAKAVARFLSAHGINENRLSAVGYGESSPIADNKSIKGRAKNRRIEFKVMEN